MKIKEKIKKIGNRKYCLLLALLILALLFTVLMPKINLGTQKASALSAPQTKTLDLNGESYSYQTSLNELKNNYNLLGYNYDYSFMQLFENTEGENYITLLSTGGLVSESQKNQINTLLNNNIELYNNNNKYNDLLVYDETVSTDNPAWTFNQNVENQFNLSDLTSIKINFSKLNVNPVVSLPEDYTGGYFIFLSYLNNNMPTNPSPEVIYNNQISVGYVASNNTDLTINIDKISGYSLKQIIVSYSSSKTIEINNYSPLGIYSNIPRYTYDKGEIVGLNYNNEYIFESSAHITINEISFIENNNANIIKFNITGYDRNTELGRDDTYFQGNLLLSNNRFDENLERAVIQSTVPNYNIIQGIEGGGYFGGKFNDNNKITNVYFYKKNTPFVYALPTVIDSINPTIFNNLSNFMLFRFPAFTTNTETNIQYYKQNQLLYIETPQSLKINSELYSGAGLSAQVEDVLYNVEYLGNTEKIQQEKEIKKDFENMLYVTGAFAVVGLLLGFVFGNPILGLVIGAVAGFGLTIIPIILDGLQAIFGQQFLEGLQNFFRTIASSIANVVSSILNFLFSIITNPAVLVLVLIVAILYLFVFRNKE